MKTQIKTIIKVALLVPAFILLSACNNKKSNNTAAVNTTQCIQTQSGQPADPSLCQQGQYCYSYSNGLNNGYNNQYGKQQQQYGQYQRIQCNAQTLVYNNQYQAWGSCQGYNCSGSYAWVNNQYAICM